MYECVLFTSFSTICREKQRPLLDLAACTDRELICAQLKLMYSFDVKRFKYFRHWRAGGRWSEQHCKGAVLLIDRMLSSSRPLFRCASALQVISVPAADGAIKFWVHDDEILVQMKLTKGKSKRALSLKGCYSDSYCDMMYSEPHCGHTIL